MKKLKFSIVALCAVTLLNSCNKSAEVDTPIPNSSVKQSDQAGSVEVDNALDEVSNFISNKIGGGASQGTNLKTSAVDLPCGSVSIDSATTNSNGYTIYKVNYGNKTMCGYKYMSGNISFQLKNQSKFNIAGAAYDITFSDYKVEVMATGSVVTLNGTITVTNVDGGYIWEAVTSSAVIKHKIRGTINITYANGKVKPRSYFQLRTWTSSNGWAGLSLTVAGDSTAADSKIISETGRTYDGDYAFRTELPTSFVWKNCGTDFKGPYTLIKGHGIMNVTGAPVTTATVDVEAGYLWNYLQPTSTPSKTEDCNANSYKIITTLNTNSVTSYQLY